MRWQKSGRNAVAVASVAHTDTRTASDGEEGKKWELKKGVANETQARVDTHTHAHTGRPIRGLPEGRGRRRRGDGAWVTGTGGWVSGGSCSRVSLPVLVSVVTTLMRTQVGSAFYVFCCSTHAFLFVSLTPSPFVFRAVGEDST